MVVYGFVENVDFTTLVKNVYRADGALMSKTQFDHGLKLDMAKEISIIQRTEKGKRARQYFIKIEKRYKQQLPQPTDVYFTSKCT